MNIYDLYRQLVRRGANTEAHERQMLLMIDAAENGYETLEEYQEELDKRAEAQAAGNRAAMGVETSDNPDPRDARIAELEARLAASADTRSATRESERPIDRTPGAEEPANMRPAFPGEPATIPERTPA